MAPSAGPAPLHRQPQISAGTREDVRDLDRFDDVEVADGMDHVLHVVAVTGRQSDGIAAWLERQRPDRPAQLVVAGVEVGNRRVLVGGACLGDHHVVERVDVEADEDVLERTSSGTRAHARGSPTGPPAPGLAVGDREVDEAELAEHVVVTVPDELRHRAGRRDVVGPAVEVVLDHGVSGALEHLATPIEHDGPGAEGADGRQVVADEQHGAATLGRPLERPETFALEGGITDGQDLVDDEHLRLEVRRPPRTRAAPAYRRSSALSACRCGPRDARRRSRCRRTSR